MFKDRNEAGEKLAQKLNNFREAKDTIVLALPRGGVIIGYEIAKALDLPLDLIVSRKIGAPFNEEYAIGAVTENGETIFDEEAVEALSVTKDYLEKKIIEQKNEAARRLAEYRKSRARLELENKKVIIVDDGIATGLTMRAAIKSARDKKAKEIIVASPVIAKETMAIINEEADFVVFLETPFYFGAVGSFYENFGQTTDKEVIELMKKSENFGK
ncbi:MAG: phosphoribosyltransferase [Patescibacteria group bacterium]|nr:phosphoribosyltransferase [Patescibacteria group bacterium]